MSQNKNPIPHYMQATESYKNKVQKKFKSLPNKSPISQSNKSKKRDIKRLSPNQLKDPNKQPYVQRQNYHQQKQIQENNQKVSLQNNYYKSKPIKSQSPNHKLQNLNKNQTNQKSSPQKQNFPSKNKVNQTYEIQKRPISQPPKKEQKTKQDQNNICIDKKYPVQNHLNKNQQNPQTPVKIKQNIENDKQCTKNQAKSSENLNNKNTIKKGENKVSYFEQFGYGLKNIELKQKQLYIDQPLNFKQQNKQPQNIKQQDQQSIQIEQPQKQQQNIQQQVNQQQNRKQQDKQNQNIIYKDKQPQAIQINFDQKRLEKTVELAKELTKISSQMRKVSQDYSCYLQQYDDLQGLFFHYSIKQMVVKNNLKKYCQKILHVRGDGNCFYTAFGFQFLSLILITYNDTQFNEFLNFVKEQQIKFKIYYKMFQIDDDKIEQLLLQQFLYNLQQIRKIENQQDRIHEIYQQYREFEILDNGNGCFYFLSTIFFRNLCNQLLEYSEMKAYVDDRINLLTCGSECNNNEIIIATLAKHLKINIKLLFFQAGQFELRQYEEHLPNEIILLIQPGHYNIGLKN